MKMIFKNIRNKLGTNKWLLHILYWMVTYLVFFLSVWYFDSVSLATEIATVLVLPGFIPVYLHFCVYKWFFARRKYVYYFISLIVIIFVSGYIVEFIFRLFEDDPNSHISGIGVAVFYIVITMGLKYYKHGLTQQYRLQEAEFKQIQTELTLLKTQVNPHFFFNTLNNLYALSLDKSDRVPEVILEISNLMRYVLDSSKQKKVPLSKEIHFLESYIALEKLRLSDKTSVRMSVTGNLVGKCIAPMLLIPFLENSFKHGLNSSTDHGYITIELNAGEKNFHCLIENTKPPSSQSVNKNSSKMGLENIIRRLQLIYPDKHRLSVKEEDDSFRIELDLQL